MDGLVDQEVNRVQTGLVLHLLHLDVAVDKEDGALKLDQRIRLELLLHL